MQSKRKSILVICPYPENIAAGQRFRFEQYLPVLAANQYSVTVAPFLDMQTTHVLYKKGHYLQKIIGVLLGFIRRSFLMFSIYKYDTVFLYRAASPLGPPIFEYILFKVGIRTIYDFDDAIYLDYSSPANKIVSFAKCPWKVSYICRNVNCISVSVPYLATWARSLNRNVRLVPTSIDLQYHHPLLRRNKTPSGRLCIGWTGSHSTAKYLEIVRPALAILSCKFDFDFVVICDVDPDFSALPNYRFIKWQLETEIADLSQIDIGIMPSPNGEWEMGKAGFKAIQYSGIEAVSVVSATGSGHDVVIHGKTGYVVENTTTAWVEALSILLTQSEKREKMGTEARNYIDLHYSVRANTERFLSLFSNP
jgi:glycosyltransferase involved in cell wall biosynthesis